MQATRQKLPTHEMNPLPVPPDLPAHVCERPHFGICTELVLGRQTRVREVFATTFMAATLQRPARWGTLRNRAFDHLIRLIPPEIALTEDKRIALSGDLAGHRKRDGVDEPVAIPNVLPALIDSLAQSVANDSDWLALR